MNEFWGAFSSPGDDIIRNNSSHFDDLRSRPVNMKTIL